MVLDPQGFVVLDAPPNVSLDEVHAVIKEHGRWLKYRLQALNAREGMSSRLSYTDGELVHWRGEPLTLSLVPDLFLAVERRDKVLEVRAPSIEPHPVRKLLTGWYQREAQQFFSEVLAQYQDLPWLDGKLPPWRHRFMRSQWGSCSSRGKLSLNTHLVKTPVRLVEYVVLHELCHLQHHNHSRRFHSLVERYMPDWERRSAELDRYLPVLMQG